MRNGFRLRPATLLIVLGLLCLLLSTRPAAADPTDVVAISVNFGVVCITLSCTPNSGTVSGSFHFDPDTESIVGPWSFSTPFGSISSSSPFASSDFLESETIGVPTPPGFDVLDFGVIPTNVGDEGILVQLIFQDPQDSGTLVPTLLANSQGAFFPTAAFECTVTSSSGCSAFTNVLALPTPEPSSLLLLGTGLLGLGPLIRRRLARW